MYFSVICILFYDNAIIITWVYIALGLHYIASLEIYLWNTWLDSI